jgi:NADPH:quinone reductase-like Zn-dependent oxidoreductase
MSRTQAVRLDRAGPATALRVVEVDLADPGPGEVQVAIEAAGVAYADVVMRNGLYPGVRAPVVPGYDLVGRIVGMGPGVTGWSMGARVAAVTITGSYARRRNVAADLLVEVPDAVDASQAVACVLNGVTAFQMFHHCVHVAPGEWVLVHGAAGGVGLLLLDLAAAAGARAIGTASAGKLETLRQRGAEAVDYASEDFVERTRALTTHGVVAAFDHLGGRHFRRSVTALRPGGTAVLYGAYDATRGGRANPAAFLDLLTGSGFSTLALFQGSRGIVGYNVSTWRDHRRALYRADLAAVMEALARGTLRPAIGGVFALEDVARAHQVLESRGVSGKVVLKMD